MLVHVISNLDLKFHEFTPEEDLLYTSIAVLQIFDRIGDRKNMARNRMRYLVNEMGWAKFKNLVLKERTIVRATQSVIIRLNINKKSNEIKAPDCSTNFGNFMTTGAST